MDFSPIRDRWNNASTRDRGLVALAALALLALVSLPFMGGDKDGDIEVNPADTKHSEVVYTVESGDSIIGTIAPKHQVPWEAIAVVNETELARVNAERCGKLSKGYTQNTRRKGHYCNGTVVIDGRAMVNLNSLQPGDTLRIPMTSHPVVDEVVAGIDGRRIAIAVDVTGSMSDDLREVSAWYMRAWNELGKEITTVVLYADGHVTEFSNTDTVRFTAGGSTENTRHALETAAASNPDAIVLVSDEPGDDWGNWDMVDLPPVYAHSLEEISHENLRRVAEDSGGKLMRPPLGEVLASR